MKLRKFMIAILAVGMPLTVMSTVGNVGAAWAATHNCTKLTGTITYLPPLKNGGTSPGTMKVALTATACTGSPHWAKVVVKATAHLASNACTDLIDGGSISGTYYALPPLRSFTDTYTGPVPTFNLSGRVTGSGALGSTPTQLSAECAAAGVAKIAIKSGHLSF